jgi:hypothetical protein
MSSGLPILYLCAIGGLFTIVFSFWLLWKQRIFLDSTSKEITEIELLLGIKVKTSLPVILLILIGGALLMYSVNEVQQLGREVTVDGTVSGTATSVELFASVASQSVPQGGDFSFQLPVTFPARKYTLLYTVDGNLVAHQIVDQHGGGLKPMELQIPAKQALIGQIDPVPAGY